MGYTNTADARANCRKWNAANRDRVRATGQQASAKWRKANPDKRRASLAAWHIAHPEKRAEYDLNRRVGEKQRTPAWADSEIIGCLYAISAAYTAAGIPTHVDHIYPLRGELVSGLHVHQNLTVLPAWQNQSKGNR